MIKNTIHLKTFGTPGILSSGGRVIEIATRKSLSLVAYLSRAPEKRELRENLMELFWSGVPREKAQQSLRQSLRQLRHVESGSGIVLIEADKKYVHLKGELLTSDVDEVGKLLASGTTQDFKNARPLIPGSFMQDFEALLGPFADWLQLERQRIETVFVKRVLKATHNDRYSVTPERMEAGARVILALDSSNEEGHRLLIRSLFAMNRPAEAEQHFKLCREELKIRLDAEPDEETLALFEQVPSQAKQVKIYDSAPDPTRPDRGFSQSSVSISLPQLILIEQPHGGEVADTAQNLLDEIRTTSGCYRNLDIYTITAEQAEQLMLPDMPDDGELGSYILRFRYASQTSSIYIQLENRQTGQVVFNEVLDVEAGSAGVQIRESGFQIANRIQQGIIGRLRRTGGHQPFSRWCHAEALLWEFNRSADQQAENILSDLTNEYPKFSLPYAGLASVKLKKLLYYPASDQASDLSKAALRHAERAVMLDPWQMFSQRMYGWASIQQGSFEDAERAFSEAWRLNPRDPINLISVAEGFAFIGQTDNAQKCADIAFAQSTIIPRFFYEYQANIHFSTGNYEDAVEFLYRSPNDSLFSILTRISSLLALGREREAEQCLELLVRSSQHAQNARQANWLEHASNWLARINLYQNRRTRQDYMRGIQFVSQRLNLDLGLQSSG